VSKLKFLLHERLNFGSYDYLLWMIEIYKLKSEFERPSSVDIKLFTFEIEFLRKLDKFINLMISKSVSGLVLDSDVDLTLIIFR
jgi:hypothetical protein